jgi:UDP-N-acetylmuramate--alanine ligase
MGAKISIGHHAENVTGADVVIRSSAIPADNVEVLAAQALGIPVLKRSDFMGQLMEDNLVVAVAGTSGKTTTTAMIAWMLAALGEDPSFIVGGVPENLGANAHAGSGLAFVVEADEYDRMFLGLAPRIAIVTNIEHDHPDCFPTPDDFYQAFVAFSSRLLPGGVLVACGDDPGAARLAGAVAASGKQVYTYGVAEKPGQAAVDFSASDLRLNSSGGFIFRFSMEQMLSSGACQQAEVSLQVPGRHNVLNALAALAVACLLELPLPLAAGALSEYHGVGRRFELRGEAAGVTVIDDYAHHPSKIKATLAAARARYPGRRLWAVWQPHTYSRTRALFADFVNAFKDADQVVITEVYPAREPVPGDFSSRLVADQISKERGKPETVFFAPDLTHASQILAAQLRAGDVLLVLSAGDADKISGQVLDTLGAG